MAALNVLFPAVNDSSAAASNVTRIQALLDAGGNCELIGSGIVWINARLVIKSNTRLKVDPRLTIKCTAVAAGFNSLVTEAYTRSWLSASLSWTAGLVATLTLTSHGLAAGDYVWIRGTSGTTDTAYFGVFRVLTAPDANTVTVRLRQLPNASVSGTIEAKKADKNITVEGGTWDYYYTGGNAASASDGTVLHNVVLAGVHRLRLRDMVGTNTAKYCFCVAGISDFRIEGIGSFAQNSDTLKIYGPAWDGVVAGVSGESGDDMVSLQTREPAAFSQYDFSHGSCLNIRFENIEASAAGADTIALYGDAGHLMDGIVADGVVQAVATSKAVRIDSLYTGGGRFGSVSIKNVQTQRGDTVYGVYVTGYAKLAQLELDGLLGSDAVHSSVQPSLLISSSNVDIGRLVLRRWQCRLKSLNVYSAYLSAGTIGVIDLSDSDFEGLDGSGTPRGSALVVQGATIGDIIVKNNRMKDFNRLVELLSGSTVGRIVFENNSGNCVNLLNSEISMDVAFRGNRVSVTNVVRANGASVTLGIKTDGCNKLTAGSWFTKVNGAETLNVEGDDIAVDASTVARFDGGHFYNTNAALGTLGAAGRVTGQGTSSGSWKLLADPTKSY